jgi:hypothetical protein
MFRNKLRTLLIALALGPPVIAVECVATDAELDTAKRAERCSQSN